MLPGGEHEISWHNDLMPGRMVAMSINLTPRPFSGGAFEIREQGSPDVLRQVANTGFGDAVLFRVHPTLQHRVGRVEGEIARTAYAGWFLSDEVSAGLFSFPPRGES